jgi:glucose 1-dehydrogenase
MAQDLNKIIVITGSSRGFGKAMAEEFQRAGACVVISSRHAQAVEATVQSLPRPADALGVPCDVRDLDQVRRLAEATIAKLGRIDVWINNAGISPGWGKLTAIDPMRWRESFDTNFYGTYHGCRVALDQMLPRRQGQIVNILGAGADRPAPNQSAYGTSKAAVAMFTKTLASEYAGSGITVNAVMPGLIWTEMVTRAEGVDQASMRARLDWAMRVFGNPPEVPARFVLGILRRGGESGKTYRLMTPRVFVPRMLGDMLGAGKRNPRPWEAH